MVSQEQEQFDRFLAVRAVYERAEARGDGIGYIILSGSEPLSERERLDAEWGERLAAIVLETERW